MKADSAPELVDADVRAGTLVDESSSDAPRLALSPCCCTGDKRARSRMAAIVASSPNAIISMDLDGTIETWNEAATKTFGYTADEVIGESIALIVPNEREDQLQQALAALRKGHSVGPIETTRVRRDGTQFDALISGSPVRNEDGTITGVAGTVVDIADRKMLNAQLRQAQKMETIGTLAGGVAHDFNNILHSSTAYLTMALDALPPESPARDLLERSRRGLDRAEDLVGKLLTFSRREATTMTVVDFVSIVQETIELTRPSLPDCIQLELSLCAGGQPCMVRGDAGQLQQVIMNLVTNAIQALKADDPSCSRGGTLHVDVRTTTVDADRADHCLNLEPGRYARVTVRDTGPGMDPETKARIFDPFFTTKEAGEGTGLGLSVVHGIVQSHDGDIHVASEPGEGTTFEVYIPSSQEPHDGPAETDSYT